MKQSSDINCVRPKELSSPDSSGPPRVRLAVICSKKFWFDGKDYKAKGGFIRQMEALAEHFDEVVLCVPVEHAEGSNRLGYVLNKENISVYELPAFTTLSNFRTRMHFFLKSFPQSLWRIWRGMKLWDVIHPRMPDYLGLSGVILSKLNDKPMFIYIGGDWKERIIAHKKSVARIIVGRILDTIISHVIKRVPTFVLGNVLLRRYKKRSPLVYRTVASTISEKDISETERFRNVGIKGIPRILYVGRLADEKGLTYLVEGIALLIQKGREVTLDIVGDGPLENSLRNLAQRLNIFDQVNFAGFVPLGPQLDAFYEKADIFVLPSLSEAQGKVLLEAMAKRVAVVATNVGGIPTIIKNGRNGLLVSPRSAEEIAIAIERLIDEPDLRRKLVINGIETAREFTFEKETGRMMEIVNKYLKEHFNRDDVCYVKNPHHNSEGNES